MACPRRRPPSSTTPSARSRCRRKDDIVTDTVDSIAARFNLRYSEQKWLDATAQLLADDPQASRRFMAGRHDALHRKPVQPARRRFRARSRSKRATRSSKPCASQSLVRQSLLASDSRKNYAHPRNRFSRQALHGSNFFSSGLRQKVDQLMNILWAGGVNNPMDSIEQISYLLFLRLLTEKDDVLATPRQEIHAHLLRQVGAVRLGQLRHPHRRQSVQRGPRRHRKPARTPRPDRNRQAPVQPRHAQDLRPPHAARRRPGHPRARPCRPRRPRLQGRHV